jgi:hypothetical protein
MPRNAQANPAGALGCGEIHGMPAIVRRRK